MHGSACIKGECFGKRIICLFVLLVDLLACLGEMLGEGVSKQPESISLSTVRVPVFVRYVQP